MTPDMIATIVLLSSLVVGLIISMFQAATSINEQTLTFIPKLATIIIVLMILGPWMLQVIVDFFQDLMHDIPLYFSGHLYVSVLYLWLFPFLVHAQRRSKYGLYFHFLSLLLSCRLFLRCQQLS